MISKDRFKTIRKAFYITFFLGMGFLNANAQETNKFLSLKEAIDEAVANNTTVKSAKIDEALATEKYKQTNAGFLPQLNFSFTGLATDNPLNTFGFKLQQRSVTAEDFNPAKLNHPSSTSDFTTKVELLQPIVNMDAVYMKKSASVQIESYQLKTKRTKDYLAFETQKAYHQLQMVHQAVLVLQEALTTAKSVYDFTNNRMLQGLVQKSDLLNVEVQILGIESNLNEALSNVSNASDYLSVLMNRPTGVIYTTEELKKDSSEEMNELKIPDNRFDLMAIKKAIEATNLMEKSVKMKMLPRLNAFGSYQLNDKSVGGFNSSSYLAGIQLTWNIFDGNNVKRQVSGMKLEQQKLGEQLFSIKQETQMLLDKSNRDLTNSSFKIKQQNAAISQAEEALRILQNRYEEGLVNTNDVLTSQTQLSQQKLMLVQAIYSYNISRAYIQFLTTNNQ